jgi:adenine-specific DNA-methyltransferase
MADDKKTNEKKQRLLTLLREMFQLDQPDLDFGLYRIMHAKRGQVEAFLETEFDQLIDKVFADRGARHEEEAKKEYEAARQQAIEFGAPDPDAAPKVQQARARYEVVRLTGGEDAEIYDHLHRFFSRYYDHGDFMSLRQLRQGRGRRRRNLCRALRWLRSRAALGQQGSVLHQDHRELRRVQLRSPQGLAEGRTRHQPQPVRR